MLASENRAFVVALDDAALAKALVALVRDAELRAQVGGANRRKAARDFGQAAMVRAWGALLDGALGA